MKAPDKAFPAEADPAIQEAVGTSVESLAALYVLQSLRGFGPQKFKDLLNSGLRPRDIISSPDLLPMKGKRGAAFRTQLEATREKQLEVCRQRAARQILAAHRHRAMILTYDHPAYPRNVLESNNPIPVLYVRGSLDVLESPQTVACVGSRKSRPPYSERHAQFARLACELGFTIVSGFALGADTIGHVAAHECGGRTICVMPGGLHRPFPPENTQLWERLLSYQNAVFVSEFPFGTRASSLTLRKRNKLIAAFGRGVLVSQSAVDGGAMNAFRFAIEQRKPVATFAADGTPDTSGNNRIEMDSKANFTVFPAMSPDREAYERWLRGLSSLI